MTSRETTQSASDTRRGPHNTPTTGRDLPTSKATHLDLKKELPNLVPGSIAKPADVYLPLWKRGKSAAIDVTVISLLQATRAHRYNPQALSIAENKKRAKHRENCATQGVCFITVAVETFGRWREEAVYILSSIASYLPSGSSHSPVAHMWQRLAVALQRRYAALWIRRMPTNHLIVDGAL